MIGLEELGFISSEDISDDLCWGYPAKGGVGGGISSFGRIRYTKIYLGAMGAKMYPLVYL